MRYVRKLTLIATVIALACSAAMAQGGGRTRLTLEEAIQRGLQHNLGALLAESLIEEAQGTLQRRTATLYPRARFDAPLTIQSRNLKAQGIAFPGIPDVVGPFTTMDFRVSAEQSVFDRTLTHARRAATKQVEAARQDYQDARNDVIRQVAALYLNGQAVAAQVVAAESRVRTAEALHKLASDQRDAGVATGIDVLRAEVRLSNERQALIQVRNSARNAVLTLARAIGISPSTDIELADTLAVTAIAQPDVEQAVIAAIDRRSDYQALAKQHEALGEQLKSSQARSLPRFALGANYGGLGRTFNEIKGVGQAQATVSFTIFDRDREGERREIQARARRVERQMTDLRLGIEQEIRQALLNLESAEEEVAVAQDGLKLAERELELARVRFENGVTNNIEVINAQDSLARAQQGSIVAMTRHTDARIALAHALGNTEQNYRQYLGK